MLSGKCHFSPNWETTMEINAGGTREVMGAQITKTTFRGLGSISMAPDPSFLPSLLLPKRSQPVLSLVTSLLCMPKSQPGP